jgi:hypothetical protein
VWACGHGFAAVVALFRSAMASRQQTACPLPKPIESLRGSSRWMNYEVAAGGYYAGALVLEVADCQGVIRARSGPFCSRNAERA